MSNKIKLLLLALVIIAGFLIYAEKETKFITASLNGAGKVMMPSGITYEYGFTGQTAFAKGTNGFLCATGDGVSYYNYKGDAMWRETFTMNEPYIISSGTTFAVLEPLGRKAYVCNEEGILYTASTDSTILGGGINGRGCLILILREDDGTYSIPLYLENGEQPIVGMSEVDGVFPVSADISEDGTVFAVSYLDTSKTSIISRTLYSYTKEGAEKFAQNADKPFKAIEQAGSVVSKIHFFTNGNLLIQADDEVLITTINGEEVTKIRPQNRITSSHAMKDTVGVLLGEPLTNASEPDIAGTARWYSSDGKIIGEYLEEHLESIAVYNDLLLLKDEHSYYCLDLNGRILWKIGAGLDILSVMPINEKSALIAKASGAELYNLKMQMLNKGVDVKQQDANP